MLIHHLV